MRIERNQVGISRRVKVNSRGEKPELNGVFGELKIQQVITFLFFFFGGGIYSLQQKLEKCNGRI